MGFFEKKYKALKKDFKRSQKEKAEVREITRQAKFEEAKKQAKIVGTKQAQMEAKAKTSRGTTGQRAAKFFKSIPTSSTGIAGGPSIFSEQPKTVSKVVKTKKKGKKKAKRVVRRVIAQPKKERSYNDRLNDFL